MTLWGGLRGYKGDTREVNTLYGQLNTRVAKSSLFGDLGCYGVS